MTGLVNLDPTNYVRLHSHYSGQHHLDSLPDIPSAVLASWQARGLELGNCRLSQGFPERPDSELLEATSVPGWASPTEINEKWVIRAGYGMYYWPMPLSQILQASRTNPPLNLRFANSPPDTEWGDSQLALLNAAAYDGFLAERHGERERRPGISTTSQRSSSWILTIGPTTGCSSGRSPSSAS